MTDLDRRAGLLFGEVKITDERTDLVEITEYRQDFPYVGMPLEVRTAYDTGSSLIYLSVTTYEYPANTVGDPAVTTHTGVYFPHARKETTRAYELTYSGTTLTGSALTSISERLTPDAAFDGFGNLEDLIVKVYPDEAALSSQSAQFTSTTANTFTNDTTNWLIGQLTCQVATAAPTGGTALTSTAGFKYADGTTYPVSSGLVITEVVEPVNGQISGCVTVSSDENITVTTTYEYDDFGNRTEIEVDDLSTAAGGSLAARATQIAYGELDATNTVVAANGRFPVQVMNAESHTEYRQYDGRFGALVRLEGPNGLETFVTYDSFGRPTAELRADGTRSEVHRAFCSTASPCATTGGAIKVLSLETGAPASVAIADKYGRTLKSAQIGFDGVPVISKTEYDDKGQVEKAHKPYVYGAAPNPEIVTTFQYDVVGRAVNETAPGDTSGTDTEYLSPGTDSSVSPSIAYRAGLRVTNDKGQESTQYFDALGELIAAVDAAGTATRYTYDAHGNLATVTVDNDTATTITNTYDLLGRKRTMADPDMGGWDYFYNSFGELRRQEDANGNVTELEYDLIGRLVERTENGNDVTTFTFDTATYGIGKIAEVAGPQDYYSKTFAYDDKGRPSTTTTELPNLSDTAVEHTFVTGQSFDPEGRLDLVTYPGSTAYPSGLQVRYSFNDHGYLEEARNDDTGNALFWQRDVATPMLSQVTLGNSVTTTHSFHADTGRLYRIRSTDTTAFDIQDLEYAFDSLGNLTERSDHNRGLIERVPATGGYDALNRLTSVERYNSTTSQWDETAAVSYDVLGNVLGKTGKGTYVYDAVGCGTGGGGPHAVKTIGTQAHCYDDNGNETQGYNFDESRTRTTAWTAFNKPASITEGGDSIAFDYGPDRARFRQINDFTGVTTLYVDGLFELETVSGVDTAVHYVYAGGEAVAIYKSPESGSPETLYLHRDHLGSVVEITDESGAIYQSLSYDAFGKRRDPDDWGPPVGPPDVTKRGYTAHEHLDDVGIIHMNGRVYDPDTARMLSADPYVAFPTYSQSYNRYAYVLNNPLNLVDPSGFCPTGGVTSQPIDGNGKSMGPVTCLGPQPDDCLAECQSQRDMNRIVVRSSMKDYRRLYDAGFLAGSETIDWGWGQGVIGWTTISISVSYQGIFWPTFSGSVANNAMTGTDTHPQLFENTSNTPQGGQASDPSLMGQTNGRDTSAEPTFTRKFGKEKLPPRRHAGFVVDDLLNQHRIPLSINEQTWLYHNYADRTPICRAGGRCNVTAIFEMLRRYAAPGVDHGIAVETEGRSELVGGNMVWHIVDRAHLTVINITEQDHVLYNGFVLRSVVQEDGEVWITTWGEGMNRTGFWSLVNRLSGPAIFDYQDTLLKREFEENAAGP